jgi:hypothetical protein
MRKLFKKGDVVRVIGGSILCYGKIFSYSEDIIELVDGVECGVDLNGELLMIYIGKIRLSGRYNIFEITQEELLYYNKVVKKAEIRIILNKGKKNNINKYVILPEQNNLVN